MSIAALIRAMAEAGATPEAIAIAVEAIESRDSKTEERKRKDRERKRASKAAAEFHGNSTEIPRKSVESCGNSADVPRKSGEDPSPEVSPKNNIKPLPTPTHSSLRSDSCGNPPKTQSTQIEAGFAEFYAAYPKRTNRKAALARYATAIKAGVSHERIMEGTRRYAEAVRAARTEPQFIKAPDAWLNAGKYDDEHLPQRQRSANGWAALAAEMMEENRDGKRPAIEEIRTGEIVLELPRRVEDGSGKRDDERGELPRNPATALIRDAVRRM